MDSLTYFLFHPSLISSLKESVKSQRKNNEGRPKAHLVAWAHHVQKG